MREPGSDTTTFNLKGDDRIRGTANRSYTATTECAPSPRIGGGLLTCPAPTTLGGAGRAEFSSPGALLWTGKRARGPRLTLFLYLDHGDSCPGWEGIFSYPALYLDGLAAGLSKLRVGGAKTLRVTQKASCVDQVSGTQGDATSCTLSASADVVVRRTS